jgi:hypothetical protein
VKNALYTALDQEKAVLRTPSDGVLRKLLFEVAGLLNYRPLTYTSSDPDDFRPLTPNDFLNRARGLTCRLEISDRCSHVIIMATSRE